MKKIVILDANILIDLVKTGLFDLSMELQYDFSTTDIVLEDLDEQQLATIQPHICSAKCMLIRIPENDLAKIQRMSTADPRLSEQDWSTFFYAQQQKALLITDDTRMKKIAASKGITTCGICWILDQLTEMNLLTKQEASSFLQAQMKKNKGIAQC
jgi:predicted nucleic acid-binding protein